MLVFFFVEKRTITYECKRLCSVVFSTKKDTAQYTPECNKRSCTTFIQTSLLDGSWQAMPSFTTFLNDCIFQSGLHWLQYGIRCGPVSYHWHPLINIHFYSTVCLHELYISQIIIPTFKIILNYKSYFVYRIKIESWLFLKRLKVQGQR